jgi:AcrR family transcriptional regulator
VFGTQGVQAATVKQICTEAGLTERYFYESFDNQQALFWVVYQQCLARLRDTIVASLSRAPEDVETLARDALRAYYRELRSDPRLSRILLIEIYGAGQNPDLLYRHGVLDFVALIRDMLTPRLRLPRDSLLDADLQATALVGAIIHLSMHWYLGGFRETDAMMVANTLSIVGAVLPRTQT